ncbi:MAG TPA: hypothetical protein DCY00_04755 [Actinobacteria bacterium]|nr:hypothetical protein [Actinomycetota bacterium]
MFAFIDVINILGGIDITLDQDLVDPTYKVRNNGIWSTLYYKKGKYHLDGIETLRVARARHFTPLFSRDERQQRIIIALLDKLSMLTFTDFNKIYDILKTVLIYLDTDINIPESINIINKIKDIKNIKKTVISNQNVLVQTYSNLLHLGLKQEEVDDDFDLGAWILIPVDNNWYNLQSFIEQSIKG